MFLLGLEYHVSPCEAVGVRQTDGPEATESELDGDLTETVIRVNDSMLVDSSPAHAHGLLQTSTTSSRLQISEFLAGCLAFPGFFDAAARKRITALHSVTSDDSEVSKAPSYRPCPPSLHISCIKTRTIPSPTLAHALLDLMKLCPRHLRVAGQYQSLFWSLEHKSTHFLMTLYSPRDRMDRCLPVSNVGRMQGRVASIQAEHVSTR